MGHGREGPKDKIVKFAAASIVDGYFDALFTSFCWAEGKFSGIFRKLHISPFK